MSKNRGGYLIDLDKLEAFKEWLTQHGASILAVTNQYELLRFECDLGTGVLYRKSNPRLQTVSGPVMLDAINAFKRKHKWKGKTKPTKRSTSPRIRKSTRQKLAERDGCECFFCAVPLPVDELTLEHFVPVSSGGPNKLSNMVLACKRCNDDVGTMNVADKCKFREIKRMTKELLVLPQTHDLLEETEQ